MPLCSLADIFTLQLVLLLGLGVTFSAASIEENQGPVPRLIKQHKPAASMPSTVVDFLLTSSSEAPQGPSALAALNSASLDDPSPPPPVLPAPLQQAPCTPASAAAAAAAVLPPPQPLEGQEDAVRGLLRRLLPEHEHLFQLHLGSHPSAPLTHAVPSHHEGPAFFALQVAFGRVYVQGSSGVELAAGVHWFLKHWVDCSLSWEATGGLQLNPAALSPEALAALEGRGRVVTERAVPLSFYQNVVTQSYSMAYWEWDRWERELDWMALQGINLPLAPVGMEAVWATTFSQMGLSPADLEDFFTGPSFLAWGRMGNIQGYGGPLPGAYMAKQAALQQRIVVRMRQLGMTPVFPAFAGFVPRALVARYPHAKATPASNWCRFPPAYCCPYLLDPCDPLFAKIGAAFITNLRAAYGQDPRGYYIADTFNEMRPASADPGYLAASSAAVYAAMAAADEGAVWVMQAWLFFSDQHFWHPPQIKALLGGVPSGSLLLLDLFAEEHAVWRRTEAFYGTPFVWTMLHNFGGNLELYGALPSIVAGVAAAIAEAPNCVGIGMAPEGIEQNPVVYELMAEMAFRGGRDSSSTDSSSDMFSAQNMISTGCRNGSSGGYSSSSSNGSSSVLDVADWAAAYSRRRYAGAATTPQLPSTASSALERAWTLLARSVYSCSDHIRSTVADIPTSRPGFSRSEITGWGLGPHMWYDVHDLMAAWDSLLVAASAAPALNSSSAFVYDLIDVGRELMSKLSGEFWGQAVGAFGARDQDGLARAADSLGGLLSDMDALLGCHNGFMLGPYLARALAYAEEGGSKLGSGANGVAEQSSPLEGSAGGRTAGPHGGDASMDGSSHSSRTSVDMSRSSSGGSNISSGSAAAEGVNISVSRAATSPSYGDVDHAPALLTGGAVEAVAKMEQQAHLEALYEWNARTQLTIWGTSAAAGDSEVSDYANKEWSGLISSFYAPRWQLWLNRLQQDLALNRPYDPEAWRLQCLAFTYEWVGRRDGSSFPTEPSGDAVALSRAAFNKYVPIVLGVIAGHRANAAAAAAAAVN